MRLPEELHYHVPAFPTANEGSCKGLTKLELITILLIHNTQYLEDIDKTIKYAKQIIDKCGEQHE